MRQPTTGRWAAGLALLLAGVVLGAPGRAGAEEPSLLLATTTSVRDSGLLHALLPAFREATGIRVRVVAVGSGAALRLGARGDADVLLSHAPAGEEELVASGAVLGREPFMENHFVIAGPPEDPAGVRSADSPEEAFRRLAAAGAPYVSRADDSGTHRRERAILAAAGLEPDEAWPAVVRTGTGMALALQVAGERRAYVLSDLGTFLAFRERSRLEALSPPSASLRNVYSVLLVSPTRFPRVRAEEARKLQVFLLGPEAQARIAGFGQERFGRPLFQPLRREPAADAAR